MPFDGPAAGIGDLSRMDLSNDEVVKDAEHELRHCVSDHDFARWARRWGERAIVRLLAVDHLDDDAVTLEEFDEAEKERDEAEGSVKALIEAATHASQAVAAALQGSTGPKTEAIALIMSELDEAVAEETE